jgi:hypothetical protein
MGKIYFGIFSVLGDLCGRLEVLPLRHMPSSRTYKTRRQLNKSMLKSNILSQC